MSLTQKQSKLIDDVYNHIETHGPLVAFCARRLSPDNFAVAKEQFRTMCDEGTCRPSKAEYAAPLHMIPKKDG